MFRDKLSKNGADQKLFALFTAQMETQGVITREGSLVDATFMDVPRQRNSRNENKEIKEGKTTEEWEKLENAAKLRQKDTDARWTKKNDETHYGYKDHVKVDRDSKIIMDHKVTNAAVHDSQEFVELVDEKDKEIHADKRVRWQRLARRNPRKEP